MGSVVLGLFVLLIWHPWPAQAQAHQLELTSIDVGQGDSLLLVFPDGARMLVDGGGLLQFGNARKSNLDIGEDVVSPYLWSRGIQTLDVVVATHAPMRITSEASLPSFKTSGRRNCGWVRILPKP